MRALEWLHQDSKPLPPVYVGSYEDKLSRIRPVPVDPDHERQTREEKLHEIEFRQSRKVPPFWG